METNPFLSDILSQPTTLMSALRDTSQLDEFSRCVRPSKFDRIVLTGMGASFYGSYPAWLILVSYGLPAWCIEASELLHSAGSLITSNTLLWIISQSGRSAEIQALLERKGHQRPALILATTNDADSPLATQADITLQMHAGEEFTVSTRSYVNTLALTQLSALTLTGNSTTEAHRDLEGVVQSASDYLEAWDHQVELIARSVGSPNHLIVLGRGPSRATALTGALVLKEAAKANAEGMSVGQFRHGPLELADSNLTVLVLSGSDATIGLNRRLALELLRYGAHPLWVSPQPDPELPTLPMPAGLGFARPIAEILPLQLLCLPLAQLAGFEPGRFRHSGKVTSSE